MRAFVARDQAIRAEGDLRKDVGAFGVGSRGESRTFAFEYEARAGRRLSVKRDGSANETGRCGEGGLRRKRDREAGYEREENGDARRGQSMHGSSGKVK